MYPPVLHYQSKKHCAFLQRIVSNLVRSTVVTLGRSRRRRGRRRGRRGREGWNPRWKEIQKGSGQIEVKPCCYDHLLFADFPNGSRTCDKRENDELMKDALYFSSIFCEATGRWFFLQLVWEVGGISLAHALYRRQDRERKWRSFEGTTQSTQPPICSIIKSHWLKERKIENFCFSRVVFVFVPSRALFCTIMTFRKLIFGKKSEHLSATNGRCVKRDLA